MAPSSQLEAVLRYAYLHGLTCEQWIKPTKECLESGSQPSELCDLLLSSIFSFARVSDPVLESYLSYATAPSNTIISPITFITHLVPFGKSTASRHPYQWSFLLKLLPDLLLHTFDTDTIVSDLQKGQQNEWVQTLDDLCGLLSHIVAVGMYPDWYATNSAMTPATLTSALSFHNANTQAFDSQFSFQSQQSANYDPDNTIDMDNTQQLIDEPLTVQDVQMSDTTATEKKKSKKSVDADNAVMAAQLLIQLIEKRGLKRIFEVRNNQRRQAGMETDYEPWRQCQDKLESKQEASAAAQNPHIQKLLLLIQRLTDRDLERRMAVHMKYHELEDEGTARAMPSAGLMGLLYHIVQIRPSLDDEYILDHLLKLQTIKGSFDESFYLELWLTALTGLREASLNTSCQGLPSSPKEEQKDKSCSVVVATNRLLWKSLVLVKLPHLLNRLQAKKKEMGEYIGEKSISDDYNSFESSLKELKAFSGLINACSPPACCSEFFAPDSMSSSLVDKIAFGDDSNDDEDDIMKMITDIDYSSDVDSPNLTKSIRSVSGNDIFTNLVNVCERYGFVRRSVAAELVKKKESMDVEEEEKISPIAAIDQNIDTRCEALMRNMSFSAMTELLHIGLVSPIHLRKVIDFLLQQLKQKAAMNDFHALSDICDALTECPCSVDLILQLYTPSELLGPLESICNYWNPSEYDMETDMPASRTVEGQEELFGVQLLYSKFGIIWNFAVAVVKRFKLYRDMDRVFQDKNGFLYSYFNDHLGIYGIDLQDDAADASIASWKTALVNTLPDDLLKTTTPQQLLRIVPTIIYRSIVFHANQKIDEATYMRLLSHFQKRYLSFAQSVIYPVLCEELLSGHSAIALASLRQLIMTDTSLPRDINFHPVLGSLESLLEFKRQEAAFLTKEEEEKNIQLAQDMTELMQFIHTNSKNRLTENHSAIFVETVTTGVSPSTLFQKTTTMFKYIVKSGRSLFMSDVDADTNSLWDDEPSSKMQVVSHYLDMVLFETALEFGGGHWFVSMIVDQVLEAGKCGGAVRAAELGSCLITTPLLYSSNRHNSCVNLLRCLLQDVLPASLYSCAEQNMSFFQGQTLGVFTSDCLVLMQDRYEEVKQLGKGFFEALVINSQSKEDEQEDQKDDVKIEEEDSQYTQSEETKFADWDDDVTKSAAWRGFVKGLMSNPMIEEVWPNAFV